MEFRQLEAFINTVRYGSISKAADACFLSQPTISTHISNLEHELGVVLINRKNREISLTPRGEQFYPMAVNMVNMRAEAERMMKGHSAMDGVLNICTSSIPGEYYLPGLLARYHALYPGVRIHVVQTDTKATEERILNRTGEIGLVGECGNEALDYFPIFDDELALLVPNRGKYANMENGSRISFSEIEDEDFILRDSGSGTGEELKKLQVGGIHVFQHLRVIMHINNMETIKKLVAAGLGVSIMTRRCVTDFSQGGETKYLLFSDKLEKRQFYMVTPGSAVLSPEASKFRSLVMQAE